jgi:uncharacterized protein (TIGR03437 family)
LSGAYFADVSIEVNGVPSDLGGVTLAEAAPGIFTRDSSGKGQAACLNQDYSANSDSKPAAKGSVIMLYLTGEGQTAPAGTDGLIATNPKQLPAPLAKVTATIDGQTADVQYAGGAQGMVAGLMQVNVKIPDAARSGSAIPVVVQVGNAKSADAVTVAIQ